MTGVQSFYDAWVSCDYMFPWCVLIKPIKILKMADGIIETNVT